MFFKRLNNIVRVNGLVSTFLVYATYPNMSDMNLPSLTITKHGIVMSKAIEKVWIFHASYEIDDILTTRNDFTIIFIYKLRLKSMILAFYEENPNQW